MTGSRQQGGCGGLGEKWGDKWWKDVLEAGKVVEKGNDDGLDAWQVGLRRDVEPFRRDNVGAEDTHSRPYPIKKNIGEEVRCMSRGTELDKPRQKVSQAIYKQEASELNKAAISDLVSAAADGMDRIASAEKVSLSDVETVRTVTRLYMRHCAATSMLPTMSGLAGALGYTRQGIYIYIKRHPESETAHWLQDFSDKCGEIMMQAALSGNVSAIPAIFTAKARYGWKEDEQPVMVEDDTGTLTAREIMEKYQDLPD